MQELSVLDEDLFSIIIPSYNHEKYVLDCLESIKRQKYPQIEIIIVDDCSQDNTFVLERKWVDENSKLFSNVILLRNENNLGVVKTVNRGLNLSHGQYIIRLASDDCLLDDAVENIVNEYKLNMSYGMICFDGVAGENYSEIFQDFDAMPTMYGNTDYNKNNIFEDLYREDFIAAPGCIIMRETYLKLGLYDENSWIDDWEYYLRITKNFPILFSKTRIVFFRQVQDSLSHSPSVKKRKMMNQGVLYVLEKYKGDVKPQVAKKVMHMRVNLILREVLEWRENEFLSDVLKYMKRNKIKFTLRSFIKYIIINVTRKKCSKENNKQF